LRQGQPGIVNVASLGKISDKWRNLSSTKPMNMTETGLLTASDRRKDVNEVVERRALIP
jgi:hypothetical protein